MRALLFPFVLTFTLGASAILFGCSGAGGNNIDGPGSVDEGGATSKPEVTPDDEADAQAAANPDGTTTAKPDAAADRRIDPIDVGRTWTYDVTILGTYPLCKAGPSTGRVLGQKEVAGKQAFQIQSFCPGAGTSSYAVDGDKVEVYYSNAWILSLDAPVAEGHTWTDGLYTYVWEKAAKATTVGSSTFDECWNARLQAGSSYTTFCRGVGPVRWHFVDAKGNGYDATLTAYTN